MSGLESVPGDLQFLVAEVDDFPGIWVDFRAQPRMVNGSGWVVPFVVMPLYGGWMSLAS